MSWVVSSSKLTLICGGAEVAGDFPGQFHVERLVDGGEYFLFHQLLDHQVRFYAQFFG